MLYQVSSKRRSACLIVVFAICLVVASIVSSLAFAAERVALVIGNGAYQKEPALPNPPQDARDIAAALGRLGFKVTQLNNLTATDMRKAVVDFGRAAEDSDISVIFYAGHGMEVSGENWLIPVDAELRSDTDIENESISLKSLNLQVSKSRQLGLIILDACRNNPFAAKMKRSIRTRTVTRGLAATEPTDNVLIAYAARDGTTAGDGDGRNSPFTKALLNHIETPGLEVSFLFRHVRDDVMKATQREQQPFVYGSLSKEAIFLKPDLPSATEPASSNSATNATEALTVDDIKRIEKHGEELKLRMPKFAFGWVKDDVTPQQKHFVGAWATKVNDDSVGRPRMLIVTDVLGDGTAVGNYIFGPPTKASWEPTPAGYTYIVGKISGPNLHFKIGSALTAHAKLGPSNLITLEITRNPLPDQKATTSTILLLPLWQFSPQKLAAIPISTKKKTR